LTNETNNISLFSLVNDDATSFLISVKDSTQIAVQDAYIYSQRYYQGLGVYNTVAMGKTDDSGNTVLHFKAETEDYRIIIMKEGEVLYTSKPQKIYCTASPCTLPIQIETGGVTSWVDIGNLANLIYEKPYYDSSSKQVIYSYIDTSGTTSYGRLKVWNYVNSQKNFICDVNSTSNSGTLTCNVSEIEGLVYAEAYISRSPEVLVYASQFVINTIKNIFGLEGLFWAMMIILVITIAGSLVAGSSGGILGVIISFWLVQLLNIASFGMITIWGVTVLGVVALWVLKN
jgi:hypothetical protein